MSVKYMYKYVYKGHAMASVALVQIPLENSSMLIQGMLVRQKLHGGYSISICQVDIHPL